MPVPFENLHEQLRLELEVAVEDHFVALHEAIDDLDVPGLPDANRNGLRLVAVRGLHEDDLAAVGVEDRALGQREHAGLVL